MIYGLEDSTYYLIYIFKSIRCDDSFNDFISLSLVSLSLDLLVTFCHDLNVISSFVVGLLINCCLPRLVVFIIAFLSLPLPDLADLILILLLIPESVSERKTAILFRSPATIECVIRDIITS